MKTKETNYHLFLPDGTKLATMPMETLCKYLGRKVDNVRINIKRASSMGGIFVSDCSDFVPPHKKLYRGCYPLRDDDFILDDSY